MFDVGDLVYHEKYGAGRIVSPAQSSSKVLFDMKDTELKEDRKADIENKDLSPLKEVFHVNRLVHHPEYGMGTVRRLDVNSVSTRPGVLYIAVEFFSKDEYVKCSPIKCSPKCLTPLEKKSIDISPDVILRDIYNNARKDIPGRESEFLSDVKKEDIKKLGIMLRSLGDRWEEIIKTL